MNKFDAFGRTSEFKGDHFGKLAYQSGSPEDLVGGASFESMTRLWFS